MPLRRSKPPSPPTELELESLAAPPPAAEETPPPEALDLPARAAFQQPITGAGSAQRPARQSPYETDDSTSFVPPTDPEDKGGDG
jgi:hypothetical protein